MDEILLKVPASGKYLNLMRLVVAGVGNNNKFTIEQIEDMKIAVTEASYELMRNMQDVDGSILILFKTDSGKLCFEVSCEYCEPEEAPKKSPKTKEDEKDISIFLMKSLMDEFELKLDAPGKRIFLAKYKDN